MITHLTTLTLVSSVAPGPVARSAARAGSAAKTSLATATTKLDKCLPSALCSCTCMSNPLYPSTPVRFSWYCIVYSLCNTSQPVPCFSTFGVRVICSTSSPVDEPFQSLSRENHLSVSYICHTFFRVSGYTSREMIPLLRSCCLSTLTLGLMELVSTCFSYPDVFLISMPNFAIVGHHKPRSGESGGCLSRYAPIHPGGFHLARSDLCSFADVSGHWYVHSLFIWTPSLTGCIIHRHY